MGRQSLEERFFEEPAHFHINDQTAIDAARTPSWFISSLDRSFVDLNRALGKPMDGDGDKTDAMWVIYDEVSGVIATVYNYKNGKAYCGTDGLRIADIAHWSIGGRSEAAAELVMRLLDTDPPIRFQ